MAYTSHKYNSSIYSIETYTPSLFSNGSAASSPDSAASSVFEMPPALQSPFHTPSKTPSFKKKLSGKFQTLNQSINFSTDNLLKKTKLLPAFQIKSKHEKKLPSKLKHQIVNENVLYFKDDEIKLIEDSYYRNIKDDDLDFLINESEIKYGSKNSCFSALTSVEKCFQNPTFINDLYNHMQSNSDSNLSELSFIIKEQCSNLTKLLPKIIKKISIYSELSEIIGNEIRKLIRLNYNELNSFGDSITKLINIFWNSIIEQICQIFQSSFENNFKLKITWFKFINYLNDLSINQWEENYSDYDSDFLHSLQYDYSDKFYETFTQQFNNNKSITPPVLTNYINKNDDIEYENDITIDEDNKYDIDDDYNDLNSITSLNTVSLTETYYGEELDTKLSDFVVDLELNFNEFEFEIDF